MKRSKRIEQAAQDLIKMTNGADFISAGPVARLLENLEHTLKPDIDWPDIQIGAEITNRNGRVGSFITMGESKIDVRVLLSNGDLSYWPVSECTVVKDNKLQIASDAIREIALILPGVISRTPNTMVNEHFLKTCDNIIKTDLLLNHE